MNDTSPVLSKADVYRRITDQIVTAIEAGAPGFEMPWHWGGAADWRPVNASTGKSYQGINVVALWAARALKRYRSNQWATYRQWASLGAQVNKGEQGTAIVFYKRSERTEVDDTTGEERTKTRFLARASVVFNAEQVVGWQPPKLEEPTQENPVNRIEQADQLVTRTGAFICHEGTTACYLPAGDMIRMPQKCLFTGSSTSTATEAYYATLFHELTHWSGAEKRLNRSLTGRFGDSAYAMEELVAELGAAFLCADVGVTNVPRLDHAAYVASWLRVLRDDKKALFTAARQAQDAAMFLQGSRETRH